MRSRQFTQAQIVFVLKQTEDGTSIGKVCRKQALPRQSSTIGAIGIRVCCHQTSRGYASWKRRTPS